MAFVNIMIHAVWGTKNRVHFLTDDLRPIIINHIKQNAKAKNIHIDRINGYKDHLHCLFSLNAEMSFTPTMISRMKNLT
jgi:REP element-mobilizing transposase RayT